MSAFAAKLRSSVTDRGSTFSSKLRTTTEKIMSRTINQKHFNHQKHHRKQSALRKRGLHQPAILDKPTAVAHVLAGNKEAIVTEHQRQARNSNPTAPIRLSAKKVKKITKRARINKKVEIAMMESL